MLFALIIWLLAVTVAITIHEFAHALSADKLGDPTARAHGRLSLNPKDHYDPVGTTMLFVTSVMRAFGAPVIPFGWAKPVMFDPYNLENPKRDAAIIALSGPAMNLIGATILSLGALYLLQIPAEYLQLAAFSSASLLTLVSAGQISLLSAIVIGVIGGAIVVNVALAIFNLIPVHPLDGSKIIMGILPKDIAREYIQLMNRFGFLILIFLIFPIGGTPPIFALISPIIMFLLQLLLPAPPTLFQ
jgi:Zn-dependent protease